MKIITFWGSLLIEDDIKALHKLDFNLDIIEGLDDYPDVVEACNKYGRVCDKLQQTIYKW